jgi:hypothetical protein
VNRIFFDTRKGFTTIKKQNFELILFVQVKMVKLGRAMCIFGIRLWSLLDLELEGAMGRAGKRSPFFP